MKKISFGLMIIMATAFVACNNAGTDGTDGMNDDSSVVTSPEGSYPLNTSDSAAIQADSSRMDSSVNRPAY